MKSDDLLRDAAGALRTLGSNGSTGRRVTRSQVMGALVQRRRTQRTRSVSAIALVACLTGSTVWAASTGRFNPRGVWDSIVHSAGSGRGHSGNAHTNENAHAPIAIIVPVTPITPVQPAEPVIGATPSVIAPVQQLTAPITATTPNAVEPVSAIHRVRVAVASPSTPVARTTTSTENANNQPEIEASAPVHTAQPAVPSEPEHTTTQHVDPFEALFRSAQQADFVDRNPTEALQRWRVYLAADPSGRFALEAQYNLALDLVRLGQRSEAVDALRPFASGVHNHYRQREATRLISALTNSSHAQ